MTRYRATLLYDGTRYNGFQRQQNAPSIQSTVEQVLEAFFGVPTPIIGAGRTDTGVHAIGQVIVFDALWSHSNTTLLTAINNALPVDIALHNLMETHDDFHPRYDAQARIYHYSVMNSPVRHPLMAATTWQVAQPLNVSLMNQAASLLIGRHDFATFGKPPRGHNTVREVADSEWFPQVSPYGDLLVYRVEATAFLHHMVRRIVRMLVEVGRGWQTIENFEKAFHSANLRFAGKPAPPQGLVLVEVRYLPDDQHRNRTTVRRQEAPSEADE
jgi:tRNA pseudouridine38-40 synthase